MPKMVNKRTVNGAISVGPFTGGGSVGRAAATAGRCVTMNGSPAVRPRRGACAIESVSDIYAAA